MRETVQPVQEVPSDRVVANDTRTVDSNRVAVARPSSTITRVIWFIAGVILVLLAFRFVLVLLGANSANGFVNFIYSVSHPLAAPFFGIFGYSIHYGVSRFELSTLVAMAVYALIAFGLAKLVTIRQPRPT